MGVLLSIVVPFYNTENYLNECIDSILMQGFHDYELILVDDGSIDNSGRIGDEYAAVYDCIHIIHQKNQGVSAARNAGMRAANGKYLFVYDGDDILPEGCLAEAMEKITAKDADMLLGGYSYFIDGTEEVVIPDIRYRKPLLEAERDIRKLSNMFSGNMPPWSMCRNIVRADVIFKNNLWYDTKLAAAEDCDFFMKLCSVVRSICFMERPLLCYRIARQGSIMTHINTKDFEDISRVYQKWQQYYEAKEDGAEILACFSNAYFYTLLRCQSSGQCGAVYQIASRYLGNLKYTTGYKKKIVCSLFKVIGIKTTLHIAGKF